MKISNISFKNIHSLRGVHHIDFLSGPLAESGLFAITGPTGSGKSTLLDVITLALYNKVPRIGSISKSVIEGEGGIMTRNAQDCYAEVEYIVNGKIYRSHWSIERNRNGNLNDRKQEIIDVLTGVIIESGKSSVPSKNEELIGLSYDQFVKAMVLSQGQFSKLLKAKRDERNKLLEDITGAKDYRAIGVAVFKKFKTALEACKEQEIRLDEIELIPKSERKDLSFQEKTLAKEKESQKTALEVLKVEIEHRNAIFKQETILTANKKLQNELTIALEGFKKEECLLEDHTKFVVHNTLIANFDQKNKALIESTSEFNRQKLTKEKVLKDKAALLEMASSILGKKVAAEEYVDHLTQLRWEVNTLKEEENLAVAQAKLHEKQIKAILLEVNSDTVRIPFKENPIDFSKTISPVEAKIQQFLKSAQINNEEAFAKKEAISKEKLRLVSDLKVAFTHYTAEKKNRSSKEAELKSTNEQLEEYQVQLKKIEKELKPLELEVEKLIKAEEIRKQHQSLEAHRSALIEGKACPLCGSLEHPFATHKPHFDFQAETLKSKQELLVAKRELKISTQANLKNEQGKSVVLDKILKELSKALHPKLKEIEKLCSRLKIEFIQDSYAIVALEKTVGSELQLVEQVKKAFGLRKLLVNLKLTTEQWIISADLKVKKEAVRKTLYAADDIDIKVQSLLSKWTQTLEKIKHANELISELNIKVKTISEEKVLFENQLQRILETEHIDSVAQLKTFILSEGKAEEIRQKKQRFQLQQERLKTEKETAHKEIHTFEKIVKTAEPIPELQSKYQKLGEDIETLNEKILTIKARLDTDKKTKEKQSVLQTKLKDLKREEALWKTMNGLIGDANGKRFSNFVQDLTLEQLIGYTNLRLQDLSDRYRVDIPTADEADKNDSLKVFDSHQGDARRSINTLSGGETFMVSLAMAFALSDLAAKNVKIESIFIDEGFGTLDPDTLNQAITILEKMQNEGDKSIGVISHVEALKERISTQIRLEKTGAGYSTIEIV